MLIESPHYVVLTAGMEKDKELVKWHLDFSGDKHFSYSYLQKLFQLWSILWKRIIGCSENTPRRANWNGNVREVFCKKNNGKSPTMWRRNRSLPRPRACQGQSRQIEQHQYSVEFDRVCTKSCLGKKRWELKWSWTMQSSGGLLSWTQWAAVQGF